MPRKHVSLTDRFLVPPFTVLDTRQDYWRKRKAAWLALGIKSELGRGADALGMSDATKDYWASRGDYVQKNGLGAVIRPVGGAGNFGEHYKEPKSKANATPGGSLASATRQDGEGKTVRGDGKGRRFAQAFTSGKPGTLGERYKDQPPETANLQGGLTYGTSIHPYDEYGQKKNAEALEAKEGLGSGLTPESQTAAFDYYRVKEGEREDSQVSGTSIFDPVLCELAYRWFCPPSGVVLDPFAGGSVRGIVAAALGMFYMGVDLSEPQVAANKEQWVTIGQLLEGMPEPQWFVGDSKNLLEIVPQGLQADFVFTCPPYGYLERYSDDPRDISTMTYQQFLATYMEILKASISLLKPNRFACLVISDFRNTQDGNGYYHGFVASTIAIMKRLGLELYNDAVLLNAVGSLPIRVGHQFDASRKLGRGHQNVLVFVKGDARLAAEACGGGKSSKIALAGDSRVAL